jgi:uncharacterized FlgJ-related protein
VEVVDDSHGVRQRGSVAEGHVDDHVLHLSRHHAGRAFSQAIASAAVRPFTWASSL